MFPTLFYKRPGLLLVLILPGCSFAQTPTLSSRHVKITEARRQGWSPGIVRENTAPAGGYIYELTFKVRKKGAYEWQALIVKGESLTPEVTKIDRIRKGDVIRKRTRITLTARSDRRNVKAVDESLKNIIGQEAGGWLRYRMEGKSYLVRIESFSNNESGSLNQ